MSFKIIAPVFLIPCLAACTIAVAKFTYTFYTTAMVTGGFILVPIFGIVFTLFIRLVEGASGIDSMDEESVPSFIDDPQVD
jgi:hypothetical protein